MVSVGRQCDGGIESRRRSTGPKLSAERFKMRRRAKVTRFKNGTPRKG